MTDADAKALSNEDLLKRIEDLCYTLGARAVMFDDTRDAQRATLMVCRKELLERLNK